MKPTNSTTRLARTHLLAGLLFGLATSATWAQNAVVGKQLYLNTNGAPLSCGSGSCHGPDPALRIKKIQNGTTGAAILAAIANVGDMRFLGNAPYTVTAQQAADIAAYIVNPAAGNGAPAISLSAATLTFAAQTIGTTSSAQTVTISNTGTAVLTLSGLAFSGTASAEFARTGTCQIGTNIAVGGNCSLQVTFAPAAAGARSASLTISHNATGGTSAIALSGTGALAPAVASVTPTTLSFTQTVNTTSNAQVVTVSNTGGQPLTLGAIGVSGANAAEFLLGGTSTCAMGTVLNGGANCNVQMTFRPTAAGARTGTLSIAHSASASPANVALNGTGTATAVPAVSVSAASLTFGTVSVGQTGAAQSVTLTNSGQAPLTLASLTLGGTAAADFKLAGTCISGTMVAAGGTCTMQLSFAPAAVGARSGTVTVASNASNGNAVVALSGSGVQFAISANPTALSMQSTVGATSAPMQAVVTNSGGSPITLSSISMTGPFVTQTGSNACGAGPIDLIPGQSCSVYLAFLPAAAGAAAGEVVIASASLAAATRIALTGQAAAQGMPASNGSTSPSASAPAGSSALAPSNLGGGGAIEPWTLVLLLLAPLLLRRALKRVQAR